MEGKQKISHNAQRIIDESLFNDKDQLRKILHGCVTTGSNAAKNEVPIRTHFKRSEKLGQYLNPMAAKII